MFDHLNGKCEDPTTYRTYRAKVTGGYQVRATPMLAVRKIVGKRGCQFERAAMWPSAASGVVWWRSVKKSKKGDSMWVCSARGGRSRNAADKSMLAWIRVRALRIARSDSEVNCWPHVGVD
jgi:hypothetical protein